MLTLAHHPAFPRLTACGKFTWTNYSPFYGTKCGSPVLEDQTTLRQKFNIITKINGYSTADCVTGE